MSRSLKKYALAAEIIGAIAVVVSLIYVAVSVNQNTKALMVANHQAIVAMEQDSIDWFKDPDFVASYADSLDDINNLSSVQWGQVESWIAGQFNVWEFAFLTHDNGMMEDNVWEGYDNHFRTVLKQPGRLRFWSEGQEGFSPAFRMYVDSILAVAE